LLVSSSLGTLRRSSNRESGVKLRRRGCVQALGALLLGSLGSARAQREEGPTEYQVKAAFLYKFIGYVEWPAGSNPWPADALVIGVVDAGPMADELSAIVAQKSARDRQLAVRRVAGPQSVDGVHVLFIGRGAAALAEELLRTTTARPVLTVTESEAAFALGSVINFVIESDRVRFDVAPQRAERKNIKISSRLLSVARRVV